MKTKVLTNITLLLIIVAISSLRSEMIYTFRGYNILFLEAYLIVIVAGDPLLRIYKGSDYAYKNFISRSVGLVYFAVPFMLACIGSILLTYEFSEVLKYIFLQYFYYVLISHLIFSNLYIWKTTDDALFRGYTVTVWCIVIGGTFATISQIDIFIVYYDKLLVLPMLYITVADFYKVLKQIWQK